MPLTRSIPAFALAVGLMPLGTAFTFPCVTGLLSQVIAGHERGLYMGVQQTFGGLARVLAPIWAGFAWDHLGAPVPFWTGAVLVGGAFFLGQGVESRAHKPETAAAAD
jgi:MFS family permease